MPEQNEDAGTLCVYVSVYECEPWEGQGELFLRFCWGLEYLQESRERISENLHIKDVKNVCIYRLLFVIYLPYL